MTSDRREAVQPTMFNEGYRADWALHALSQDLAIRHAAGQFDDAYKQDWAVYNAAVSLQRRGWPSPVPPEIQALLGVVDLR